MEANNHSMPMASKRITSMMPDRGTHVCLIDGATLKGAYVVTDALLVFLFHLAG